MFWVIVIIVVIVVIYNASKKKKQQQGGAQGAPAQSAGAKSGQFSADSNVEAQLTDLTRRIMAMPEGNAEQDVAWVRSQSLTDQLCLRYTTGWAADGSFYKMTQASGEDLVDIEWFTVFTSATGVMDQVHLRDGGEFVSNEITYASMGTFSDGSTVLTNRSRAMLMGSAISVALEKLPTLRKGEKGRFYVVNGAGGAAKSAPKSDAPKSSGGTPPKAGDKLDHDAFARAFAHMNGDSPAPKAPETPAADFGTLKTALTAYLGNMWNATDGSLYTDPDMPIHHFDIQVKEDRLVESVWLKGDEIPIVNETTLETITNLKPAPVLTATEQSKVSDLVCEILTDLKTVARKDDLYYPIRKEKAPAPKPADTSAAPQDMDEAAKQAALRAQIQAMMERQKKDDPKK